MKTFFTASLLLTILSVPAMAEERAIVSAGNAVRSLNFVTETPFEYVDFYKRRFDYKTSRDELRADIDTRREHYNSARSIVIQDYKNDLKALYSQN